MEYRHNFLIKWTVIWAAVLTAVVPLLLSLHHTEKLYSLEVWFPLFLASLVSDTATTFSHECGHAVFGWLFGYLSIPIPIPIPFSNAAGFTFYAGYNIYVQIVAFCISAYGCFWTKYHKPILLPPLVIMIIIAILGIISGHEEQIMSYMGTGGSIYTGGILLLLAFTSKISEGLTKVFLYAFFGSILIVSCFSFAYLLVFNSQFLSEYGNPSVKPILLSTVDNDFVKIIKDIPSLSIKDIAIFTMFYSVMAVIIPFIYSIYVNLKPTKNIDKE